MQVTSTPLVSLQFSE